MIFFFTNVQCNRMLVQVHISSDDLNCRPFRCLENQKGVITLQSILYKYWDSCTRYYKRHHFSEYMLQKGLQLRFMYSSVLISLSFIRNLHVLEIFLEGGRKTLHLNDFFFWFLSVFYRNKLRYFEDPF